MNNRTKYSVTCVEDDFLSMQQIEQRVPSTKKNVDPMSSNEKKSTNE
jgi:hypothetical protein